MMGETKDVLASEAAQMAPVMTSLASITAGFYQRYGQAKKERGVLDFSDFEQYTLALLLDREGRPTETAKALRERFEEILVDEYQDINPAQEAILQAIHGKSLVMVGDGKQSIYGFRQAAPQLFLEKHTRFDLESRDKGSGCDEVSHDGVLVKLAENYRSSQRVVRGINQVFDFCMTMESTGIDYAKDHRLVCAAPFSEEDRLWQSSDEKWGRSATELHLIHPGTGGIGAGEAGEAGAGEAGGAGDAGAGEADSEIMQADGTDDEGTDTDETVADGMDREDDLPGREGYLPGNASYGDDDDKPDPGVLEAEALFCARRIHALVGMPGEGAGESAGESVLNENGGTKPIRYRDIVILLPVIKRVAEVFATVLRNQGIPVYAEIGGGYFQAQEVQTAVSFLKVLDNPAQDIPLAALMLSPAIGFSPEELGRVRAAYLKADTRVGSVKWGNLYQALLYASLREEEIGVRGIRDFLEDLASHRRYARQSPVADVLLRFYESTGFLAISAAMAGGVQRKANLLALVQKAWEYEETNLQGLYPFIKYLEEMEKKGVDLSPASIIGEGEDVVRIMSIHRSKGLEFPIVILAQAGRKFNLKECSEDLLLHQEEGMASRVFLIGQRVKFDGAHHRLTAMKIREKVIAEEQRLLYVAMTRAQQRLILLATDKKAETKWLESPAQANSFMDWVGPAVAGGSETPNQNAWSCRVWSGEAQQHMPDQGAAMLPAPGQPQAGKPQAEQSQAEQSQAGQPQAGQPQAGQPQAGQPQAGQPQAEQSQAGQSQAGQPQAGQPQAGQPQAGQSQAGQPQAGQAINCSLFATDSIIQNAGKSNLDQGAEGSGWSFLSRQLAWRYPYAQASVLRAKLSVTQAKGRLYPVSSDDAEEALWNRDLSIGESEGPRFLRDGQGMTAAERGILLHRVLARIQPGIAYAKIDALAANERDDADERDDANERDDADERDDAVLGYLEELLGQMVDEGFLRHAEKDAVDRRMLAPFLSSDLFHRMADADREGFYQREASFTLAAPASRLYPELDLNAEEDTVVIQGIIDAYFTEGGRLVLVDYKSDRVEPGREDILLSRYEGQLRLYAEGLEAFTGKKVDEMVLYALQTGKALRLG
ncbi:MAG: UvrD-helicase domain-containing protein, partial [Clostridiales bacterium]|nr:UvrD-helicase domain-containing protein [Clostridiales bacterium]